MSTDTQTLIHQSLQGNRDAFGQIVEQYQAAVSAVTYSITGNLAQSEDLAQETFIIAWRKLGSLENPAALAPWLCGIARNLARDWVRRQSRRPTVPLDGSGQHPDPNTETPEARQQRQEQSDLVWTALAQIPENYREPLILFYRQGESIRAIAEALELTEDNVKQRLSRGRKLLRAEVESMVEITLTDTRPGKTFTLGVLAALPALYGAKAAAAESATPSVQATVSAALLGPLLKLTFPMAAAAVLAAGFLWWTGIGASNSDNSVTNAVAGGDFTPEASARPSTGRTISARVEPTAPDAPQVMAVDPAVAVSGTVVFRDTGEPAPNMRVMLYLAHQEPREVVTQEAGTFSFEAVPAGDYYLLASDARVEFSTMNSWRSEEVTLAVEEGKAVSGVRLEVPPLGETLSGRVTDAQTGEPLSGIQIEVVQFGAGHANGISGSDGRYRVFGLEPGSWLARVDRQNALFAADFVKDMENLMIEEGAEAVLDFEVDRGIPIHGSTVDADGRPVPGVGIDAALVPSEGTERNCLFRSDDQGHFTVWGARTGDAVLFKAAKDHLGAHHAVVLVKPGETPEHVTLTMRPITSVSGRFVDEEGRPVVAQFWSQPHHPDFRRSWRGQDEAAVTFTAEMTQGTHEIMGRVKGMKWRGEDRAELLEVGVEPIRDLVIEVTTVDPNAGEYTVTGRVVDELGQPLVKCRVSVSGDSRDTMGIDQQTHTDSTGSFSMSGLMHGTYRVHAYPGARHYVDYAGFEKLNPADTPRVEIVVRRPATLRGRVLDARTNEPVPRFVLECGALSLRGDEQEWGPMSPNINARDGAFAIPARLDEPWYLWVFAEGYAPKRLEGGALSSGEDRHVSEIKLSTGRIARGAVVDHEGQAVPRAQVYLHRGFAGGPRALGKPVTETDSEGRFTVTSIPDEDEYLYFWKQNYASTRSPIGEDIHAVLTSGGAIEGRVTVGGLPPEGEVQVHGFIPDMHFAESAKLTPDATYRFDGLMEIGYRIQTTLGARDGARTYYAYDGLVVPKLGETLALDIDVPAGSAAIEGTVLDNGVAVPGAQVNYRSDRLSMYLTTGEDGAYRFESLPPGRVTVSIYVPQEAPSEDSPNHIVFETDIAEGEVIQQDLAWPG